MYEHLDTVDNEWAQRIAQRRPYKVALELHNQDASRIDRIHALFKKYDIDNIYASSNVRLSKYHAGNPDDRANIFVVDQYDKWDQPSPVDQATKIFQKYEEARVIDRFYVAPEKLEAAKKIFIEEKY